MSIYMWAAGRRDLQGLDLSSQCSDAHLQMPICGDLAGTGPSFFFFSGRPAGPVEAQNVAVATQDTLS